MNTFTKNLMCGLALGVVMAGLVWISSDHSWPLNRFFADNRAIGMTFVLLNWPGIIFGMVISGNAHGGSEIWNCVGTFLQWTVLGYFFSWLLSRKKAR